MHRHRRGAWGLAALCAAVLTLMLSIDAAAGEPAKISIVARPDQGGATRLKATVTDAAGRGVEGASVTFLARTAFGWLKLAEIETGRGGHAILTVPASPPMVEAAAQLSDDASVRARVSLGRAGRQVPADRPGRGVLSDLSPQPALVSPYPPPQILIIAALLAGVWTTYAYAVSLLVRIKRAGTLTR